MKSDYIPAPIDVSDIQLPSELCELVEIIAKNVHEVWAAGRLAEGWKYGSERNDMLRTHPGLVPYEELVRNGKRLRPPDSHGDFKIDSENRLRDKKSEKLNVFHFDTDSFIFFG